MENKTHWKKLDNPNYIGAYSLMDGEVKDLTVIIEKVVTEEVKTDRGKEICKVAYLKGQKPMILNATNSKAIQKIYGTPYIEDWKGKAITLYVAKIRAFGDEIECLRIRDIKPKQKALNELKPSDTDNWNKVILGLKNGFTIEQVKTKWLLSKENQEKLISEAI